MLGQSINESKSALLIEKNFFLVQQGRVPQTTRVRVVLYSFRLNVFVRRVTSCGAISPRFRRQSNGFFSFLAPVRHLAPVRRLLLHTLLVYVLLLHMLLLLRHLYPLLDEELRGVRGLRGASARHHAIMRAGNELFPLRHLRIRPFGLLGCWVHFILVIKKLAMES